jgi:hypothetical protein
MTTTEEMQTSAVILADELIDPEAFETARRQA